MLLYSTSMQVTGLLRKKTTLLTGFILFAFVMFNFFSNMAHNNGVQYVSQMYDPMKMVTLSDWSVSGYFMMEFFPVLLVIPTASSYLVDRETGWKIYVEARTGKTAYWVGKIVAVFLVTVLLFTLPFLLEILLNAVCFSMNSTGDPSGFSYLQTVETEGTCFMGDLWMKNRIVYVIVQTLIFGVVAGILAVFNFSITLLPVFRYKIFTFFPIYILCYLILLVEKLADTEYTMSYFYILRIYNTVEKNYMVYLVILVILTGISLGLTAVQWKRDDGL